MTLWNTAMRGERVADYMDEAVTHFGTFTAPRATRLATMEEMMIGNGYCSDCKKKVKFEICKYWWRTPVDQRHNVCCVCGGSNVEFLVRPPATKPDIPAMMEKLEAIWHDHNKQWRGALSLARTLALILPSHFEDAEFTDAEFHSALNEVLAIYTRE